LVILTYVYHDARSRECKISKTLSVTSRDPTSNVTVPTKIKFMTPLCSNWNKGKVYENFSSHQYAVVTRYKRQHKKGNNSVPQLEVKGMDRMWTVLLTILQQRNRTQRCLNWRLSGLHP